MPLKSSVPHLGQLTPYHVSDPSGQNSVRTLRFQGSQRLNLMRPTRLPANSRRYSRGDPVHLIDWRAFARNEQLIIREHLDEASCRVQILIDEGVHLSWPDLHLTQALGLTLCTKRELVWRLAIHLAYQYLKAGDTVRLYQRSEEGVRQLPLRSTTEAAIYFEQLVQGGFQAGMLLPLEVKTEQQLQNERCDILFWISDGLQGIPDWLLQKKGSMASWIHALASLELDVSWLRADDSYFEESSFQHEYLGKALLDRQHLEKSIQIWRDKLEEKWLKAHQHYMMVHDASPIQQYLFQLERSRQIFPMAPFERNS